MRALRCQTPVIILVLSVGCGTHGGGAGTRQTIDRLAVENGSVQMVRDAVVSSEMVPAPAARVWSILPRVYEELGVRLSAIDSSSMWLGNRRFRLREINGERLSHYLDCGSGVGIVSYADTYLVTMALITGVSEGVGGGSVVETQFQAIAEPRTTSGNELRCTSKRTLERRILEIILEYVEMDS